MTRADFIRVYRQKHSEVRHEYLALATKHSHLQKTMLTFTVGGRGRGTYTKLRIINEVKKHLTHLINVAKANTYYFSAIEIADSFTNPHLHTQIWTNDIKSVEAIRLKVIEKFNLNDSLCYITYETSTPPDIYTYVLKDYSSNLSDDEVWNLEQTKMRMRKTLDLKLRFYSRSKGKYTKKVYRFFYRFFGVLREKADEYIEWFYSLFFRKQRVLKTSTILLNLYITRVYERVFFFNFEFFFGDVISFYGFAPACAPPILVLSC